MADFISGSFSRIETFDQCPKKFFHTVVAKDVPYVEGAAQRQGKIIHKQIEDRIVSNGKTPYAMGYEYLDKWVAPILEAPGHKFAELQLTVDQNLQPCGAREWDKVYMRGVVDVMILNRPNAVHIDWKTGKSWGKDLQLEIGAVLTMQHYPEVDLVGGSFAQMLHGVTTAPVIVQRTDVPRLWEKINGHMEEIQVANRIGDWPAKRNKFCAFCQVNKMGKCPESGVKPR